MGADDVAGEVDQVVGIALHDGDVLTVDRGHPARQGQAVKLADDEAVVLEELGVVLGIGQVLRVAWYNAPPKGGEYMDR